MRRRARIDLGQLANPKEEARLDRKRQKWFETHKNRPEQNPFLKAINPNQEYYGDPDEKKEELKARLENQEFGNFPGYFNYRNKASNGTKTKSVEEPKSSDKGDEMNPSGEPSTATANEAIKTPLESGLSDERLLYFRKEWFEGKTVLDIGCNRGHITYAIARLFSPQSITGIDIDYRMINMANKDIHLHLEEGIIKRAQESRQEAVKLSLETNNGNSSNPLESAHQFPISSYISQGPLIATKESSKKEELEIEVESKGKGAEEVKREVEQSNTSSSSSESKSVATTSSSTLRGGVFPDNIVFVEHNYVLARDELVEKQKAHFDTIVCLSVTKWIHLNYRDDGLKRFFRRIYKHLRPNGVLILEAQPYDNYARRKKLSDRLRANYYSIQLKPEMFDEYLLSEEVGFKRIIHSSVTDHLCAGFKRPLKVFEK